MGKAEEQWIIEPLDNKLKTDTQIIEGAVADSNILFQSGKSYYFGRRIARAVLMQVKQGGRISGNHSW